MEVRPVQVFQFGVQMPAGMGRTLDELFDAMCVLDSVVVQKNAESMIDSSVSPDSMWRSRDTGFQHSAAATCCWVNPRASRSDFSVPLRCRRRMTGLS